MEELKGDIQQIIWKFKNNIKPIETVKNVVVFMAKVSLLTEKFVNDSKFPSSDKSLRNELRPGWSSDIDQNALRKLVECKQCKSIWESVINLITS